jgi:23S rRNA (cytosine1962-C5)-methyltransferase
MDTYELIDSGDGKKWEKFGSFILCRPCPQAVWRPQKRVEPDATFSRENGNQWTFRTKLPKSWDILVRGVRMKISPTDFGHLGVFPEHAALWDWMRPLLRKGDRVLNLFAYSGGATLAAAQEGAEVCHLDASKGMVDWARENSALNHLTGAPIRWIVDDALKFLNREEKRGSRYSGIILDPPTFGRGGQGEVFKIEDEILNLLGRCKNVLSESPKFVIFSCHTPGFTPIVLEHLLTQVFGKKGEAGEMLLSSPSTFSIPSGAFARILYE